MSRPAVALSPLLLPLALALLGASPVRAAETATVQEILDGDQLYIDRRQARELEKARAPQQLSTGNSRGQIGFQSGAVGRLNRHSLMKLGQGCFLLEKGQILISGRQSGCTRSARLSPRGTNYVVAIDDNGAAEISVLEGSLDVQALRDGNPTEQPPTTVQAGQRLRLSAEGVILTILALTVGDYNSILGGPLFRDFRLPLPAYGSLESYIRSQMPGVNLPSLPVSVPSVPGVPSMPSFSLPRLF
ncbi:MAG: iron dicitrate transport regulator FecR [Synechococcaceae cyanobacterium]|nr:iron dicitrate transport regulator FecR [Synechococcaceae cyanobacterium]